MARATQLAEPADIKLSTPTIGAGPIDPATSQELTLLYTALAHVARGWSVRVETVQAKLVTQFDVDDIAKLHHQDFPTAMQYLADLVFDEMRSKK